MGFVTVCDACGLVFSNPQPSADVLASFYSPSGSWHQHRLESSQEMPAVVDESSRTWARMFDPIRSELNVEDPPRGGSVLDFGCGDGKLLDQLQGRGWDTWGIEPVSDVAFQRHRRLEAIPTTPTVDLIIAHHVLEHVPNPLDMLRQFAAASRPGGFLSVSVPRFDTLPMHRDYKYVLNGRAHIVAYTWAGLRTLMGMSGWVPVAEPPDEVRKGGRGTRSRLRVLARRTDGVAPDTVSPGDEARASLRGYYAPSDSRPLLARAGFLRLAARRLEARRRREVAARKAAKRTRD